MRSSSWLAIPLLGLLTAACSDDATPIPGGGGSTAVGGSASSTAVAGSSTGGSAGAAGGVGGSGGASGSGTSAGAAGGGAGGSGGAAALKDIVDTAVAAGSFTKLAQALMTAELVTTLKGPGPFTVFAPTDQAFTDFETANPGVLAGLSKEALTAILTYHVVPGAAKAADLKDDQVFVTANGSPLLVDLTGGVKAGGSNVTMPDVLATNGVIHVIDKIIVPPSKDIVQTAVDAGGFETLAGALMSASLVETLKGPGPFTVFAPTDAAFDKLDNVPSGDPLRDVLLYHVVNGAVGSGNLTAGMVPTLLMNESVTVTLAGGVKINASNVTMANIIAKNGVIHVVDTVLVPE